MNSLIFRKAELSDLPKIVEMLADDFLGKSREKFSLPLLPSYVEAFEEINLDPNNLLAVVDFPNRKTIGTIQLTFIPGIAMKGTKRLLIEAIRVDDSFLNQGIGTKMMEWAIEEGMKRGCKIAQLTSNQLRQNAHRFYEKLGFEATHYGFKKYL
jgi:GNAT superfamily N-acetyltransferase